MLDEGESKNLVVVRLPTKNYNNRGLGGGEEQPAPTIQRGQVRRKLHDDHRHQLRLQNRSHRGHQDQTPALGHCRPGQVQNHHQKLLPQQPGRPHRLRHRFPRLFLLSAYCVLHPGNWIEDLSETVTESTQIMIVGNKMDLEDKREVSFQEGQ